MSSFGDALLIGVLLMSVIVVATLFGGEPDLHSAIVDNIQWTIEKERGELDIKHIELELKANACK